MVVAFDFSAWWSSKEAFEQGFWFVAVPASVFFILIILMTFIGGDMDDVDADAGDIDEVGDDGGIGFQFFTLKNLVAFFSVFAWTGIACLDGGMGKIMTIIISLFAGLLMMTIMATLFYFISKLSDSGTMNLQNAIGSTGSVYLPLQKKRGGIGKIQITIQNSLRTLDAMTDDVEDIPVGSIVKVSQIDNQILVVTKNK